MVLIFLSLLSHLQSWIYQSSVLKILPILEVLNAKNIQGNSQEPASAMDGFYDQQVPFMVPGVGFVCFYLDV